MNTTFMTYRDECEKLRVEVERLRAENAKKDERIAEMEREIADSRRTQDYWKAEHLAGNEVIAAQSSALELAKVALGSVITSELKPTFGTIAVWRVQEALAAINALPAAPDPWLPIETAPKDGRPILLGYRNSLGKWRTIRGRYFTRATIEEEWEEPDECEEGWYETSVEADDVPNCWATNPTHWMPLPAAPKGGA